MYNVQNKNLVKKLCETSWGKNKKHCETPCEKTKNTAQPKAHQ
jgi:hypothetical protein